MKILKSKKVRYWTFMVSVILVILLTFNVVLTFIIHGKLAKSASKKGSWPVGAYIYDKKIGFDFAPNISGPRNRGTYYVKSHQLGYRIGREEDPGTYRPGGLLSLGCSFTYGDEVESEQTFTHLAAAELGIPAYNYGICSFSYLHALLKAEELKETGVLDKLQPQYVVLGCWSGLPDRSRSPFPPLASDNIPLPAAYLDKEGNDLVIRYPMDLENVFDLVGMYRKEGKGWSLKKFSGIFFSAPRIAYLYVKNNMLAGKMNSGGKTSEVTDFEVYDYYFTGIERIFSGSDTRIIMLFMPNTDAEELPDKALIDAIAAHPRVIPVNGLHAIQRYDISVRDYMRKHPQPPAHKAYAMEIAAAVRVLSGTGQQ
ncbi:MAG: hypothetical protein KBC43_11480 [Bacteroidales bacterium]|nr:hypothetical protein [Bacteroidales bacterium]